MPHDLETRLYSRREILALGAALGAAGVLPACAQTPAAKPSLLTRPIPRTGERLGVVGMGTQFVLDIGDDPIKRKERIGVIRTLLEGGGRVIDTAPSYKNAKSTLGDLLNEMNARHKVFFSTKFAPRGATGPRPK